MAKKRRRTFGTVVKLPSGRYGARYFDKGVPQRPRDLPRRGRRQRLADSRGV
jgi:hypothetical protein